MTGSKLPPDFDAASFVRAVCAALADPRAADLAIIPGVCAYVPALQVSSCGASVGVASWTLSTLYNFDNNGNTTAVLVACPDNLSAWNARKRKCTDNDFIEELRFSRLIIRRAPKSVESWAHRNWALRRLRSTAPERVDVKKELDFAREMAGKRFANYYAGVHRFRNLTVLKTEMDVGMDNNRQVALREVEESRHFLQTHPKDPSAWHVHRTALVIAKQTNEDKEEDEENAFVDDMVLRYGKQSQSIQTHHRWWVRHRDVSLEKSRP